MIRLTLAGIVLAVFPLAQPLPDIPGRPTPVSTVPMAQAPDSLRVVLAEILFAPAAGDTAFVELANVGERPADLAAMVLRIDTLVLPLPRLATPFAPGVRVVVVFDGRGTVEGNVVHAGPGFGLRAEGGVVTLLANGGLVLDQVAWGDAPGALVPTTGGLAMPRVERGSAFSRPPGAHRPGATTDWVVIPRDQVSPGRVNTLPAVVQLLPMNGAILDSSSAELSWYSVPGAARYRVQLAGDSAFTQPLLDQVVEVPSVPSGTRTPGEYWWRVQAIPAEGPPAPWSRPSRIEFGGGPPGRDGDGTDADGSAPRRAGPRAGGDEAGSRAPVKLEVPFLWQRKDSPMLLLESQQQGGLRTASRLPPVPHAWNRDHVTLDRRDPADNMNCGLASLAMVNHYYGGDLTQDRIGYEVFGPNIVKYQAMAMAVGIVQQGVGVLRERAPGPERDLNYGYGLWDEQFVSAAAYALGVRPGAGSGYVPPNQIWTLVVAEIDAGRPLVGRTCCHAFVIRGYESRNGRRLLHVNDPWVGQYAFDLDAGQPPLGQVRAIFAFPRPATATRLEAGLMQDSDRDGVLDFDETERFRTDPNNRDSDADDVPDRQDIESGVYESQSGLGYAFSPSSSSWGRDYDADGIATELDPDSDAGGCQDGEEDRNFDGERNGAETDNFTPADDFCGALQGSVSYLIAAVSTDASQRTELNERGVIQVRLLPESPGSPRYEDAGSTWSYQGYARLEIFLGPNCVLWGHNVARGTGPFTQEGAEIGATRGDDGTLALGATASVPGETASAGCGPGGGTGSLERTLNFPDCTGMLQPARPGAPPGTTYRFECTTKPDLGPGWTVTEFYARGSVRVP